MKRTEDTSQIERYIALDIHKEYVLAGGQNAKQEWVMPPHRISMAKFREWATANLQAGDAVVIETTTNVWDIYDIVAPLSTRTVVAHAGAVRQIAEARVKTDKEDVKRLIRLLIADIVPEVWVPPTHVRELRGMISYRNRLVEMGTMVRNRLQSLLHRHNILLPKGKLLDEAWWQEQQMSELEKLQIRQELGMLEELTKHKAEVDGELGRQSLGEVWSQQAIRLLQLPGFGVVMTMIVLSAIRKFSIYDAVLGYYTEKFPYMTLLWGLIWNFDPTIRSWSSFDNSEKSKSDTYVSAKRSPSPFTTSPCRWLRRSRLAELKRSSSSARYSMMI